MQNAEKREKNRREDSMSGFWDRRFGSREKTVKINPAAYSEDGYLINQGLLSEVPYGRKNTKEIGCGWIACYNFLKFMGKPEEPLTVARGMEKMLLWGGYIGSHPLAVWWYLHRRGYRFQLAFTRRGMEQIVKSRTGKTAGVIAYWHGKGSHYAAFVRETPEEPVRFLNAVYGVKNHRLTVRDFFKRYVKFPLCLVLIARQNDSGGGLRYAALTAASGKTEREKETMIRWQNRKPT